MSPQESVETSNFTDLESKLIQILKNKGVEDEIQKIVIHEPPELKGEHMATQTVYGKVIFKDPTLRARNIFIKKFSGNQLHTEWIKKMRIMEKESSFFNDFLPYAQAFCANNAGSENFLNFFPSILHGDDEMVVMDNLVLDDTFVMLPKEEQQDLETAQVVLSNLAKFHGVTYAIIKETGAEEFRKKWPLNIMEGFDSEANPMMEQMFDSTLATCMSILQKYPVEGQQETIQALSSMMGKHAAEVDEILKSNRNSDSLVVLNHGDCWNNNMLFKVDKSTGKVIDHIFVDLQITRFGSPCLDLGYFLYTSVKPKVRRAHLKELLQHYFAEFTKTLELFGTSSGLTFEEFFEDYKKNSQLGFVFNLMMVSAVGAFKEMDHDSFGTDMEKAMETFTGIINKWIEDNPDKTASIANELIAVVREHQELRGQ